MTNVYGLGLSTDIIWHPRTVKLFNGCMDVCVAICGSGFALNPTRVPSSLKTKYLDLQFLICSPINKLIQILFSINLKRQLLLEHLILIPARKRNKFLKYIEPEHLTYLIPLLKLPLKSYVTLHPI